MARTVDGIKDLLQAAGIGTFAATTGWGIYIGEAPATPDTCVTIYETGGKNANPKWLLDFPSIQLVIRGSQGGYGAAYDKCIAARDALLGLPSQDLNGDRWVSITAIGGIVSLGTDENKRPRISTNFALIIEPASGDHREPL